MISRSQEVIGNLLQNIQKLITEVNGGFRFFASPLQTIAYWICDKLATINSQASSSSSTDLTTVALGSPYEALLEEALEKLEILRKQELQKEKGFAKQLTYLMENAIADYDPNFIKLPIGSDLHQSYIPRYVGVKIKPTRVEYLTADLLKQINLYKESSKSIPQDELQLINALIQTLPSDWNKLLLALNQTRLKLISVKESHVINLTTSRFLMIVTSVLTHAISCSGDRPVAATK